MDELIVLTSISKIVSYNAETGCFTFIEKPAVSRANNIFNAKYAGKPAGYKNSQGYLVIGHNLNGSPLIARCHRLAWFMTFGEVPKDQIDHINRDRTDNRIVNLRNVSNAENARNRGLHKKNISGTAGVSWKASRNKWLARVKVDYQEHYIGYFTDAAQARIAVIEFKRSRGIPNAV